MTCFMNPVGSDYRPMTNKDHWDFYQSMKEKPSNEGLVKFIFEYYHVISISFDPRKRENKFSIEYYVPKSDGYRGIATSVFD